MEAEGVLLPSVFWSSQTRRVELAMPDQILHSSGGKTC